MIYKIGQIVGGREVLRLAHTLGNVRYYAVRCVDCGYESLLSSRSLDRINGSSRDSGKQCSRCYHVRSNQAFGNYRTINQRKVAP